MYEISIRQHFDAAHYLRGYEGKCENLHGHRFEVIVSIQVKKLNKIGLGYDFTKLSEISGAILNKLDHSCLNDIPPFDIINPSSENIASTIYKELREKLPQNDITLFSVQVCESPNSWVTYTEDS
ncbi:MAG: 6-carboxytetrahydropterin synthase QueD [Dehalococcoidia bacterium]|nr:6-carboxytetrahydropterin synthase QueD [Dehalococcoidia bacterium]